MASAFGAGSGAVAGRTHPPHLPLTEIFGGIVDQAGKGTQEELAGGTAPIRSL